MRPGFQTLALALSAFTFSCQEIKQPSFLSAILGSSSSTVGVVTTDFGSSGRFTVINQEGFLLPGGSAIHSDAVARYQDGLVYVINRLNRDNIQILNPSLGFLTLAEFSTGAGSNPHDFWKVSESKAYVTLFNRTNLLIVNPSLGIASGGIDLSSLADTFSTSGIPDGLPEMDSLFLEGNSLYVTLERLDRNDASGRLPPNNPSYLVEINIVTDTVAGVYTFQSRNPFSKLRRVILNGQPHLVVACPNRLGFISALDGGVEAFNLVTKAFRPGFLYAETTAGGDILDVEIKNDTTGYAVVLDAAFNKFVHRFDPSTGQLISVIAAFPTSAGTVAGLLLTPEGKLFAGDAGFSNPGVVIYDTNRGDTKLYPQPINVGLRPFDFIYIP